MSKTALFTLTGLLTLSSFAFSSFAEEFDYKHGYAYLSDMQLPADFQHYRYVNPNAPKGGEIRFSEEGTWGHLRVELRPGGMVLDSFRVLHGRAAFGPATGDRHLWHC